MPLVNIIGIFIDDGEVCTYYNFATNGTAYSSGDILQLPRNGKKCTVVVLGIHGKFNSFITFLSVTYMCLYNAILHNGSRKFR